MGKFLKMVMLFWLMMSHLVKFIGHLSSAIIYLLILFSGKQKTAKNISAVFFIILRRVRDSNPRGCYTQRFSRPPQSTTLPTLRCKSTNKFNSQNFFWSKIPKKYSNHCFSVFKIWKLFFKVYSLPIFTIFRCTFLSLFWIFKK